MKLRAQQELLRRKLWREAVASLNGSDTVRAEELFRQAAQVEFYLEEVEQCATDSSASYARRFASIRS
jgi:predicted phage-related endonuclease